MLIYNNIIFGQLSVKDCVIYRECLNSLVIYLVSKYNYKYNTKYLSWSLH